MGNYKKDNMLEKHYTTEYLYKYMDTEILKKYYKGNISEFLENSAGSGLLIDYLKSEYNLPVLAFDIKNETNREDIKECNYLKEKIEYKNGRVAFINPPFNKGLKFVYKSLKESDYCIAILSVSSFLNIDYDKYDVNTIDIFKNYDFGSCKTTICIIGIKKKLR
tara:strand:+ start:148 stop:639 length:492 start_codon:yes stop_codon:yes gene_type:complete